MKAIIFLLCTFFFCNSVNATILTVDNKYPYVAQFETLQTAHDAASAGDTIYVYPSLIPYIANSNYEEISILRGRV